MTSDNIAEYVGENNQFTEKPVTEYPPVIQDNTVTTKDYLYSNNIDTDLGNDSNLLIVFYVQIMPDDFVMQLHRF